MIKIGSKVILSDPCYTRGTWCMSEQDNMLEGNYNYFVEESDENKWGIRIKSIEIVHENYKRPSKWKFKNGDIGVDSGQAGIFCNEVYPEGETGEYADSSTFYGKCCELRNGNSDDIKIWWDLKKEIDKDDEENLLWNYNYYKKNFESFTSLETYLAYKRKLFDRYEKFSENNLTWDEYENKFIEDYESEYDIQTNFYKKRFEIFEKYLETRIVPPCPKRINYGIYDGKGIVSSSGFGDGQYNCYANFNSNGKCIGVKIKFI